MAKLADGDTVSMQDELTRINDDVTVTMRLLGL
jgi:hypothetical protein